MMQDFPLPDSLVRLPRDLVLSYGGFSLPHGGNISMLQDGDHIEVKVASSRRKQPPPSVQPPSRSPLTDSAHPSHPSYRPEHHHHHSRDRRDFHPPESFLHSEDIGGTETEPSLLPSSRMDVMASLLAPRSLLERKRGRSPEHEDRGRMKSRGRSEAPGREERERGRSTVRGRPDDDLRREDLGRSAAARGRSIARHDYHDARDVEMDRGRGRDRECEWERGRDRGPSVHASGRASQVSTRDEAYLGSSSQQQGPIPSFKCFICHSKLGLPRERCMVNPKFMRAHVATHILSGETTAFACGYCGRDDSRCYSYIDRGSSKHRVVPASNCPYFYKFQVGSIVAPRSRAPVCTNIPILCPGCRDVTYVSSVCPFTHL